MARLLNPITICIDGLCWEGLNPRWGAFGTVLGAGDELELVAAEETGHYGSLFSDASVVGAIQMATKTISDSGTRAALESGIAAAVKAMEKRGAAEKVKITLHG
jgi:hypothetical protein